MQMQSKQFADGDRTNAALGRGLGVFSVGLGLAQLTAPASVARLVGLDDCGIVSPTLRVFGARELLSGLGLLGNPQGAVGPWARLFGGILDMAFLSWALKSRSVRRGRTVAAMTAVAGVAALDAYAGVRRRRGLISEPTRQQVTIARAPEELYRLWKRVDRFPTFMTWVESVQDLGGGQSHWRVKTPVGKIYEYDAEIVEDIPGHRIAWRTLPGSLIQHAGQVTFLDAPGNRGTEVTLEMQVGGPLAKIVAGAEAKGDLRRLKQILETGDVVRSDASIHHAPHPAQPAEVSP